MGSSTPPKQFRNPLTPMGQSGDPGITSQVQPMATITPNQSTLSAGGAVSSASGPSGVFPISPTARPTPALGDSLADARQQLQQSRMKPFFGQMY